MKKTLLILVLAIGVILSGCAFDPASPFYSERSSNPNPVDSERLSNPELSETLISRAQKNINARAFEGFTDESTFGDCLAKISKESISYAIISYETELLGYPASIECSFSKHGNELLADAFSFHVMSVSDAVVEELLDKLDAELGNRKTDPFADYEWEKDGLSVALSHFKDYHGQLHISMYAPRAAGGIFPNVPSIFPCQLGADIDTVYNGITMAPPSEAMHGESSLNYRDGGFDISLRFIMDEAGAIRFLEGTYYINNDDMSFEDSVNYYDSFADSLQGMIESAPFRRGFGVQIIYDDEWTIYEVESDSSDQLISAKDILDSNSAYYNFQAEWPGIFYNAEYNEYGCSSFLHFNFFNESLTDDEGE